MVLKEEEGFFHSSGKTLGVLEAADHGLNFVKIIREALQNEGGWMLLWQLLYQEQSQIIVHRGQPSEQAP